jgi:glycosyltransferase involved in cell wall biosynthesis
VKILNVISTMNPAAGGPSQGIRNSTPELNKLGVHREIVCLDDPEADFLGKDPFPVHAVGQGKGPWFYSPGLMPWLLKNISRFDAVIVNGLWQYHSYAVSKLFRELHRGARRQTNGSERVPKLFIMPHGMLDPYFQQAKERRLKAIRNWIYWKLIENRTVNDADAVFFTCQTELLLARKSFSPYHPRKEFDVGYGIAAPPDFNERMANVFNQHCQGLNGAPYLLFLSRVHQKKGIDLLIGAYKTLLPKYPGMPKLVVAGPGLDSNFGKEIQMLAINDPLLKDSIFFTGMLTGDAKWGAVYCCDAFVLPSHQENFGIAVVEALACGKPVLISDQVNIWPEINGGGIIGTDTLEGTKMIVEKWLNLELSERQIMAKAAKKVYLENFESLPAAKKFYNALKMVIDKI